MTHAQLVILFVTNSCFFDLLLHVFFSRGSVTTGILKQKTLSLTAAVCMTELRRWSSNPAARLQSFQVEFYSPVLRSTSRSAGGGRWHAAEGTVGGNCFPGICQPRVTLAICSPPNALHLLSDIFTLAICWSCNALQLLSDSLVTLYTCYLLVLQRFTLDSGDYLLVVVLYTYCIC